MTSETRSRLFRNNSGAGLSDFNDSMVFALLHYIYPGRAECASLKERYTEQLAGASPNLSVPRSFSVCRCVAA